ncbi:MAG: redoxin domain-containing protein [Bradyrhizobium sp.]|uniref:peroxiredoxin n=1 Tax=Bradyrhizobium sp. TaxID=376 RepID=UPI0027281BAB|nr:redoxin domain-containing protein [Bradyrhizobium sp.]MDO8399956.1 redoxin domain-containing protein [Bradyrhizobium sp.]
MSKKTRKKSPKMPAAKPAGAKTTSKPKKTSKNTPKNTSNKSAGTAAKTAQAKTTKATAKKSAKGASKKPGNAPAKTPAKASHKAPSKPLKTISYSESVAPVVTASKAPAAKPPVVMPPMDKTPEPKTVATAPRKVGLSEGAKAPAFRLPRDGGDSVSLSDFKGRNLVLFFYPRADTPGCTKEAIDFSRLSGAFAESQTAVLGVSADPLKAQEAFRDKHELVTPLVSDEQHEMLDAYGVWGEKSMYGRTFLGILRTTVLIGADGRILRIWRNVKVDGHADEVLAAVRAL